ncbi:MAG TPA: hypothetical protein VFB34_03730 [Chloroflexota bacterium]|nr:hypothetical protein [Chloroflexota bacterium]
MLGELVLRVGRRTTRLFGPFRLDQARDDSVSPNGRWLAFTDWRGRLHLVNLLSDRGRIFSRGLSPAFSADSRFLAFTAPYGTGDVQTYDLSGGKLLRLRHVSSPYAWAHKGHILAATVSDAERLAVLRPGGRVAQVRIRVWKPWDWPAAPSWSWNDRSLLYWTGDSILRLESQSLGSGRGARDLISLPACKDEGSGGPVYVGAGFLASPYLNPGCDGGLFGLVRGRTEAVIHLAEHPGASLVRVRVDQSGHQVLALWQSVEASGAERYGVALWTPGWREARSIGAALDAFWVSVLPSGFLDVQHETLPKLHVRAIRDLNRKSSVS